MMVKPTMPPQGTTDIDNMGNSERDMPSSTIATFLKTATDKFQAMIKEAVNSYQTLRGFSHLTSFTLWLKIGGETEGNLMFLHRL